MPVQLLIAMLLSRLLEPTALGAYFLAMSLIALGTIFGLVGLARPIVKLVPTALAAGRPAAARHVVIVSFTTTIAASLVLALLLVTPIGRWLADAVDDRGELAVALPLVAAILVAFALIDLAAETLRGFEDLKSASFLTNGLVQRILATACFAIMFLIGMTSSLSGVLAIMLAASVMVAVCAVMLVWRQLQALPAVGAPWPASHIVAHGPPFVVIGLNVWLLAGADLWALGFSRSTDEIALYGAAARMAVLVGAPLLICNAIVGPVVAELHARGRSADLERTARSSATLSLIAAAGATLIFWLAGGPILDLLLGRPYGAAAPLLVILALGQVARVVAGPAPLVLSMTGYQRDVMLVGILTSLLTLLALVLLAPRFGGYGVAWAITGSIAGHSLVLALIVRIRLRVLTIAAPHPRDLAMLVTALMRTFRRA